MKLFLVVALCAFALTGVLSMPVAESGVQDPLSVVPIEKSSVQHVLRRETPEPSSSSSDNQADKAIVEQEAPKSIARLDDKLPEVELPEKKIEEPKKEEEKPLEEPKKEEKIEMLMKSDNIQQIAAASTSATEEITEIVKPKEGVRSVTIEEAEPIVPAQVPAVVHDLPAQEAVVPEVKSVQPAEAVNVESKTEEKQQAPVQESVAAIETENPSVKSTIVKTDEASVVPEVKSSPVIPEEILGEKPVVSAPVAPVASLAAASESQSVQVSQPLARSEIKEPETSVISSSAQQTTSVTEPEKPEDKKILPTDRVTRGTEGPIEGSSSSSEPAVQQVAPVQSVSEVKTLIAEVEKKTEEKENKPEEDKKIEVNIAEEPKPEIKSEEPKDDKPAVEASIATPEEPKLIIAEPEKKDEEKMKNEEPIITTKRSSSDVKVDAEEKHEPEEESKSKSADQEAPKDDASVKPAEAELTKQEMVRAIKDDSSSSEEKNDDKSDEKTDFKLEKKTEAKSSEESSSESKSADEGIKEEKKSDSKAEELPKPQEVKERK